MPYSQFTTITKVKEAFNLTTVEGIRFLPEIEPVPPSTVLQTLLETNIPWAIATSTEKARFFDLRSIALDKFIQTISRK
ncbi:MAG: hypothetical protein JGK17_23200 [Microcoleus sp. PH2017_10_PVI_O_A]|uniref:hypothetical protein n=1 Tax=unclassified Microcoleus TaxID=2642155 RepID=UPI001DEE04AE|nr:MULTISPECIES: hypothetical protein [unclassified Microcoleus]TAE79271.1 MAG: hypothetical protein EAZ83_22110 [Oscillatoriales cyanobacterium]MCC3408437.1 hypothetical protein [Microcoleus sp. PH2017_10_PVI_O_A]MCC3462523.1 hypothetical protein [Microcoleus sp. PH2017_11_PCY_U_A]MCC3480944.1 hypothetical protein [Microcoleus sp. PH2017_12_PCY_D_A]MCC3531505.1 hypothetical protein [Microcoleus sp. PH2017_21_RUC_O_A]